MIGIILLLLIPVAIFMVCSLFRLLLVSTVDRPDNAWWCFPLYMALALPLALFGIFLVMALAVLGIQAIGPGPF